MLGVAQVLAAGKPTAVVLTNGGVLAVPELKKSAGAIVEAWFPGVYGGRAVADVVFGAYNPGGKLPVTMYDADYVNQVRATRTKRSGFRRDGMLSTACRVGVLRGWWMTWVRGCLVDRS